MDLKYFLKIYMILCQVVLGYLLFSLVYDSRQNVPSKVPISDCRKICEQLKTARSKDISQVLMHESQEGRDLANLQQQRNVKGKRLMAISAVDSTYRDQGNDNVTHHRKDSLAILRSNLKKQLQENQRLRDKLDKLIRKQSPHGQQMKTEDNSEPQMPESMSRHLQTPTETNQAKEKTGEFIKLALSSTIPDSQLGLNSSNMGIAHGIIKPQSPSEKFKDIRLLCIILTHEKNHLSKAAAVNRTWANRCDRKFFCSNHTTDRLPIIKSHMEIESSRKVLLTKRLYSCHKSVWPQIKDNFDWIYVADDDTYCIVENLRFFLSKFHPKEHGYFGFNLHMWKNSPRKELRFAHGGSGYAMSIRTMEEFVTQGISGARRCLPPKYKGDVADINTAHCLRQLGVRITETADDYGRERFLKENPFRLLENSSVPENWFFGYRDIIVSPQRKFEALSEETIAFHYLSVGEIYALDFLLYNLARGGTPAPERGLLDIPSQATKAEEKVAPQYRDKYIKKDGSPDLDSGPRDLPTPATKTKVTLGPTYRKKFRSVKKKSGKLGKRGILRQTLLDALPNKNFRL